jgi:tRNA A64-2'-O-ribosylphosphate transferase
MSKTIPIWAAVLNRAVQRLRLRSPAQGSLAAASGGGGRQAAAAAAAWDTEVHLPPWVSANEANSVRRLLDAWVDSLLEVRPVCTSNLPPQHRPVTK